MYQYLVNVFIYKGIGQIHPHIHAFISKLQKKKKSGVRTKKEHIIVLKKMEKTSFACTGARGGQPVA